MVQKVYFAHGIHSVFLHRTCARRMFEKLGILGLMADAGSHMALFESLLPILSSFQMVHSYILMDLKKMPEDVDIMVVEGV